MRGCPLFCSSLKSAQPHFLLFIYCPFPVVSDSLRPYGLQHSRPPCPSLPPWVCSNSCHKSVMPSNHLILCNPLLLLPSIFPFSGSFPMNQLSESGGQSIGASVSASVLPMNIQGWFPLGLTCLISCRSDYRCGTTKIELSTEKLLSVFMLLLELWKDNLISFPCALKELSNKHRTQEGSPHQPCGWC